MTLQELAAQRARERAAELAAREYEALQRLGLDGLAWLLDRNARIVAGHEAWNRGEIPEWRVEPTRPS